MSGDRVFLDTNIIAYLYSDTDLTKKHIAFTSVVSAGSFPGIGIEAEILFATQKDCSV
jgi:predicted nucleic acid-binding protein